MIGVARRLAPSQKTGALDLEMPVMAMDAAALARLIRDHDIDVVVNCLGVLQDGPGSDTGAVHRDFVARLLQAIQRLRPRDPPGAHFDSRRSRRRSHRLQRDQARSRTADRGIPASPTRSCGRALWSRPRPMAAARCCARWRRCRSICPLTESATPFQPVAVEDIAATIAWLADRDIGDGAANAVSWDLMQPQPVTLGRVIEQFRWSFGTAAMPRITSAGFHARSRRETRRSRQLSRLDAADAQHCDRRIAARRHRRSRGLDAATGIVPKTIAQTVGQRPASIQDKWFARLFLIKALVIASLVLFWTVSGFIALFISYRAAAGILAAHGFPPSLVAPVTILTSLMDMSIGVLIAFRRTCAFGLIAGIVASLGYMVGAAILTPDLWIEPLGALVKTGPAIVLMLVALMTLDNR